MSGAKSSSITALLRRFFCPAPTLRLWVRTAVVGLLAYLFFAWVCIPMRVRGHSMEPTYRDGKINFCWRPAYWFSAPQRQDVVIVRMAGRRMVFLKRVVGLPGETVEFRDGRLLVDGQALAEPYVSVRCDWNLPPRRVAQDAVYLVGDNRSVPIERHRFGQASIDRILGAPLF